MDAAASNTARPLSDNSSLWLWQLSTFVLGCSTLIGFGLWYARWQPAILRAAHTGPSPARYWMTSSALAWPTTRRQPDRHWMPGHASSRKPWQTWPHAFVLLSDALDGLNGALYSESGQHWQGEDLWKAIRSGIPAIEREQDPGSEPSSLPPLYPK